MKNGRSWTLFPESGSFQGNQHGELTEPIRVVPESEYLRLQRELDEAREELRQANIALKEIGDNAECEGWVRRVVRKTLPPEQVLE